MNDNNIPLASWTYSTKEWNEYVEVERKNKKEDNIYFGIGIMIFATIALVFFRNTSVLFGFLFSIPFAVLIPILRTKFLFKHLKKGVKNPYVKIYHEFADVNGRRIELVGKRKRVKSVKIIDSDSLKLLEIDVQWMTGKGPTNEEFRFLIPNTEMETAKKLIARSANS